MTSGETFEGGGVTSSGSGAAGGGKSSSAGGGAARSSGGAAGGAAAGSAYAETGTTEINNSAARPPKRYRLRTGPKCGLLSLFPGRKPTDQRKTQLMLAERPSGQALSRSRLFRRH